MDKAPVVVQRHFFVFLVLAALTVGLLRTWTFAQSERAFTPAALLTALDDFARALDERWSYRHANRADFPAAIATLRPKAAAGMSINEFGLELHKIIALGIDGHSGVVGYQLPGTRYLPFLVEPDGERFVAFTPDRTAFLADGLPYITKIDGKDMSDWCEAASAIVRKGSAQYMRHRSLGRMRNLDFVRGLMKLPQRDAVEVELLSRDGRARRTLTLSHANALPGYGVWPRSASRMLGNNVGYLRLAYMATFRIEEAADVVERRTQHVLDPTASTGNSLPDIPARAVAGMAQGQIEPNVGRELHGAVRRPPRNDVDHTARGAIAVQRGCSANHFHALDGSEIDRGQVARHIADRGLRDAVDQDERPSAAQILPEHALAPGAKPGTRYPNPSGRVLFVSCICRRSSSPVTTVTPRREPRNRFGSARHRHGHGFAGPCGLERQVHASIQQTQRYLNVTDEELRRGLEVSWNNKKGRPLHLLSA